MAIIQISKIQQRSGNLVDLPQLDEAQFGWATDAKRLFIGKTSPNENIEVLTSYSNISFSQIDGSDGGNFNIANATNGQVLTYVSTTNTWENWPSTDILTANANFKLDLGDVGNIKMDGGATGYILETDGVGNVAWTSKGTLRTVINNLTPTIVTGSISTSTVTAGSFVVGRAYTITTIGTTNFTLIGASANTIGITFIATGVGTGDGDATLTTLTVTGVTSGALTLGMSISGTGVSANTYIAALGSGTGGNGTYYVNISQTVVSGTINGSLVMTVANTTPYTNGLAVTISGANATNANTIINGQTFYLKVAGNFPTSGNTTLYTTQDLATANAVVAANLGTYTANSGIATALISGSGVSNAGGSVNTIQFNNSGVLDGSANFTISGSNVTLNGNLSVGNVSGANLVSANFVTGTLTTAAQPNITTTGTLAGLVVAGNITPSANITYNLGNNTNRFNDLYLANSTIYIGAQTISANTSSVIVSGNLVANIVGNVSGNTTTAGTVTTNAQPNITSLGTLTSVSVSGNANIGNIGATGVVATTLNGSLTTNAQPNITSIGSLTSLSVTGNLIANTANTVIKAYDFIVSNNANINNMDRLFASKTADSGNFTATIQQNFTYDLTVQGYGPQLFLNRNGGLAHNLTHEAGNLNFSGVATIDSDFVWQNAGGSRAYGNLYINVSNGAASGSPLVQIVKYGFDSNNNLLTSITGNLSAGNSNITGNLGTGNLVTTGLITATGNINGGNIITAGIVSATGNITAPFFIGNGSQLTGITVAAGSSIVNGNSNVTVTANSNVNISAVGTSNVVVITSTGANIAGTISASGNANVGNIGAAGGVFTGNVSATNFVGTGNGSPAISSSGSLSISATSGVTINNVLTLSTGSNTTAGDITGNWTLTTGSRLQATYADLAEYYEADTNYEPGTVLEFGGEKEVTIAEDGTTRVAGVVSTNPAYAMNANCQGIATAIALQGRVPTKVRGTIHKGDMMVSAGNGFAKPSTSPQMGTVIGKALENFAGVEGIIEIAVGRL